MSEPMIYTRTMTRRDFLRIAALAGTAITLGPMVSGCAAQTYQDQVEDTWQLASDNTMETTMKPLEWIQAAALAASGHNTQPWLFQVDGDKIEIRPDLTRQLPVVDPENRELWISLGCALENLTIAAAKDGYKAEITLPAPDQDVIKLTFSKSDGTGSQALYDAIAERQNTRSEYDERPVPAESLATIAALALEDGISLSIISDASQINDIIDLVKSGDEAQYSDPAFVDELVSWLRFNKREAAKTRDGLYSGCSNNPNVPRWLGKRFVTTSSGPKQAETDEKAIRSSAGMLVIASEEDTKAAWVKTGRVYQRLALTLTTQGISSAFLNQPIEVPELRFKLKTRFGQEPIQPQLLLRYGYAEPMPRSLRRPVEDVLVA